MKAESPTFKRIKCVCGKGRMIYVLEANEKTPKEAMRLIKRGLDVETVSLEDARKTDLCFKCKLP